MQHVSFGDHLMLSWHVNIVSQARVGWITPFSRMCRLPVHLHEVMMKVRRAERELANELRREPTQGEVAAKAGITEAKLHGLHKVCTPVLHCTSYFCHAICCFSCQTLSRAFCSCISWKQLHHAVLSTWVLLSWLFSLGCLVPAFPHS